MYPLNSLDTSMLLSGIEVGTHYYWDIAGISLHGEVFMISWLVIFLILGASFLGTSNLEQIPKGWQNFMESVLEFTTDIAKNQLGESFYRPWVPFVSTLFLFIFGCKESLGSWEFLYPPVRTPFLTDDL